MRPAASRRRTSTLYLILLAQKSSIGEIENLSTEAAIPEPGINRRNRTIAGGLISAGAYLLAMVLAAILETPLGPSPASLLFFMSTPGLLAEPIWLTAVGQSAPGPVLFFVSTLYWLGIGAVTAALSTKLWKAIALWFGFLLLTILLSFLILFLLISSLEGIF